MPSVSRVTCGISKCGLGRAAGGFCRNFYKNESRRMRKEPKVQRDQQRLHPPPSQSPSQSPSVQQLESRSHHQGRSRSSHARASARSINQSINQSVNQLSRRSKDAGSATLVRSRQAQFLRPDAPQPPSPSVSSQSRRLSRNPSSNVVKVPSKTRRVHQGATCHSTLPVVACTSPRTGFTSAGRPRACAWSRCKSVSATRRRACVGGGEEIAKSFFELQQLKQHLRSG